MNTDIIKDVQAALTKGADSAHLKQLVRDLAMHRLAVEERVSAIDSRLDGEGLPRGPVCREAAGSHDVDALEKLAAEEKRLRAELVSIAAMANRLTQARNTALANEAVSGLPKAYEEFGAVLAELEENARVRAALEQKADAALMKAKAMRFDMTRLPGLQADAADMELLRRYLAVLGISYHERDGFGRAAPLVAMAQTALGLDEPDWRDGPKVDAA